MSWLPVTSICFLGVIVFAAWCSKRRAEHLAEKSNADVWKSISRSEYDRAVRYGAVYLLVFGQPLIMHTEQNWQSYIVLPRGRS
jgi:hypothetical protein